MKRIFLGILTLTLLISFTICFATGCDKHTHVFDQKEVSEQFIATDATCESKAKYYYSCECGERDSATFEYGEKLEHNWTDFVSNSNGTHTKICSRDSLHAITDTCTGGVATCLEKANCSVCGEEYGELKPHQYNTVKKTETEHWYECECGDKSGIESHKGSTATCTKKAVCESCGIEYGDLIQHQHTTLKYSDISHWYECVCGDKSGIEDHKGGTQTCTKKANCSVCGSEYGDFAKHVYNQKVIAEKYVAEKATCSSKAKYYYSCSCGERGSATFDYGNNLEHKWSSFVSNNNGTHVKICEYDSLHRVTEICKGGKATCTKKAVCTSCKVSYGELEKHVYTQLKYNTAQHWYECVCGAKSNITTHKAEKATCDIDGHYDGESCSNREVSELAKGHKYAYVFGSYNATKNTVSVKCSTCNFEKTDVVVGNGVHHTATTCKDQSYTLYTTTNGEYPSTDWCLINSFRYCSRFN